MPDADSDSMEKYRSTYTEKRNKFSKNSNGNLMANRGGAGYGRRRPTGGCYYRYGRMHMCVESETNSL